MPLETANDLDVFFDPEEFGEAAVYTAPGGQPVDLVVIRNRGDGELRVGRGGRMVAETNVLLIRQDKVTPVAGATVVLATGTFILQGAPEIEDLSSFWRCPAIPG